MTDGPEPRCWLTIGVWGRQEPRCVELPRVVHCQNCEVYQRAGSALLDRVPPEGYESEWTGLDADVSGTLPVARETVVVFRIAGELLALPQHVVREVVEWRTIRTIPNRRDAVLGLVNVRGDLHVCVSLEVLFDGDRSLLAAMGPKARLLRIGDAEGEWVIPVEDVLGLPAVDPDSLRVVPVTLFKSGSAYVRGVFDYHDQPVGWLDADLLLAALRRRLT